MRSYKDPEDVNQTRKKQLSTRRWTSTPQALTWRP